MSVEKVQFTINGQTVELDPVGNDTYKGVIKTPADPSWGQSGHVYNTKIDAEDDMGNKTSADGTHETLGKDLQLYVLANHGILSDVKDRLGLEQDYTPFDKQLCLHINTALSIMVQLGVCHAGATRVQVVDNTVKWGDVLNNQQELFMAKEYLFTKVKLLFDPPTNSFLMNALEKQCQEFEFRAMVAAETPISHDPKWPDPELFDEEEGA